MPTGPRGEKRPADVIGNAVHVMRIATGEETETLPADDGKDPTPEALVCGYTAADSSGAQSRGTRG
jgi:hypothetical protein